MGTNRLLSPFTLLLICTVGWTASADDEQHDAREGDDVTMQCRFSLDHNAGDSLTYYWVRSTASGHENVAIGNIPLETNYEISYKPEEGRYDLMVANVSYERDNGRFECRVKAGGSGRTLHSQGHALVVLTLPRAPLLTPGPHAQAQEGRELKLACSSSGGSPDPSIKWYKDGSTYPLEAEVTYGKTRAEASVATLTLMPAREHDGATFRCVVWNRAMPEGQQLDATVDLSVNYFPRIEVGPENPLRVEIDGSATMECKVDAKPQVNSVRWTRNGKYISNSFTHTIQGVTIQDAGTYSCSADNGLGHPGEKEIYLDVLFPPSVTVESKTYEAEEGGTVEIHCEVSANPEPTVIEWTMEGRPDFHQKGKTLMLTKVNADMVGTYICRAVNVISSMNGKRVERSSSASVAVLVRHKPGRAHISPDRPVAQEGTGVTLTCSAKPPGWPAPQYRWFRDIESLDSKPGVLATGNKYTIPSAHLGSEGVYHCQATNELGHGDLASVTLEVHQPPRFQAKLQPHLTKRAGEQDFFVTCSALGKPRPHVKWFKDNAEISLDTNMYEITTDVSEGRNSVFNVQSTLRFYGKARPNTNDLLPEDRGIYSCTYENEVKRVDSTMHLRIEHEPIPIKLQHKVAYDIMETAEILCRVQAYPKPEFQWFYGSHTSPLQMSSDGHYEINTTTDNNDSYRSALKIKSLKPQDYGDYYCSVKNMLGNIRPQIRLQPKGAPESPSGLVSQKVGPSFVTLKWEAGFDGGLSSTKYFVRYRRAMARRADGASAAVSSDCAADKSDFEWMEYDCGRANPCNVTKLEQQNSYTFKVKAVNTKGQSNYSNEITVTTKVDRIPAPEQVTYDPSTKTVAFSVSPTCLALMGVAEGLGGVAGSAGWQVVDTMPLRLSGSTPMLQESVLEIPNKPGRKSSRHMNDPPLDELNPRIRVKLCLQVNQEFCSEYTEAEIGPAYVRKEPDMLVAVMTSMIVFVVLVVVIWLLFLYCRSKRMEMKKVRTKDHELDSMKSAMESMKSQNQGPPPYSYPCAGMENKALEHSMDLPLPIDDSKDAVYSTQGGYAYRPSHAQVHHGQNIPTSDWPYMENSYTNSNNGGSVNSQDSMWQMKMAAANGAAVMAPHQLLERQSNYEYDPMTHGGYGTVEDYAPYQRLPHAAPAPDYLRAAQTPSRQDYCSDPYASVHKPKKRMDQHMESPYHEVSGLPEAYEGGGGDACGEDKPAHLSLSYDESLESGYSTPNTRSRRVIREIIV
ncbi:hemicentin-2 [Ostrinia nubilalis]|uniref:hemicentin-2 n=1 Tax=Ostrinia nubilalis TaxID=29057 RepID=UPI00308265D1